MAQAPKISGPAAALFDEPQQAVTDELFGGSVSPQEMRLQICEQRLNEIFDFLVKVNQQNVVLLPINNIHRRNGMIP